MAGDLPARLAAMRRFEREGGGSLLRLSRDVILLLKDLTTDPRVPGRAKVVAAAAVGYLIMPVDVVPDWLPVVGQVDDLFVLAFAVRRMLAAAGYEVIYDLWRGSEEGLTLILTLAGIQD